MKALTLSILFAQLFVLTKCKSPSTEIRDAFDKVNKSITTSNRILDSSVQNLYLSTDTIKGLSVTLKNKADSIYHSTMDIYHFIDSVQNLMETKDSSGTDLDLAENIFIKGSAGDIFAKKLQTVSRCSYLALADSSQKSKLDDILAAIGETSGQSWKKEYFHETPTIAAITILSKFKNDCTNAATLVLLSIKQHPND